MGQIQFDESSWPIVTVTWPAGTIEDSEVDRFLKALSGYLNRGHKFAVILDARHGDGVTISQRKMLAAFNKVRPERLKELMSIALLLATPLQRGLVTAVGWLAPPPNEQKVFAELESAYAWCKQHV